MKLTMRRSDVDWFVIERAEHDGRMWLEPSNVGNVQCLSLRCSARFSDADVEGTAPQMVAIADAIERRTAIEFKRCAVDATGELVKFHSPRNSSKSGACTLAEANELAALIRRELPNFEPAAEGYY